MRNVHYISDGDWSLFCPNEAPGLPDVYGEEFEALFASYEAKGLARRTVKARALWVAIMDAQVGCSLFTSKSFELHWILPFEKCVGRA